MTSDYNSIMVSDRFIPEGKTIGNLLYGSDIYEVPDHQRDFSWDKNYIETFWNDLNENKNEEIYFIGSVLFQISKQDKNKITIIDGQQRLATITILLAVVRDLFHSGGIGDKKDATLTQQYIIKEITRDKKIKKLTLNLRNKDFFYYCIQLDPLEDKEHKTFQEYKELYGKLTDTNKLIKTAYEIFKEKIENELQTKTTKNKKIEYLTNLSEQIREKLVIISISVREIEDLYMIFETINERGLELQVADLFKNYFISKSTNKEEMVEIWKNIFDTLDAKIKGFLKHYWHSKKGVVQERKLFRELKNYVEKKDEKIDVDILTKEIQNEAKIYASLQNPDSDYWENKKISDLIREFNLFGFKQALPLLVVARLKFEDKIFKTILRFIINFGFRYSIICNFSPNVLEKKYSEIAIKIRNEEIKNKEETLTKLKEIKNYPGDELFKDFFKAKKLKDKKIARYILKNIEINKFNKVNKQKENTEPIDLDKLTLEHILPQNMDDEWKDYFKDKKIALKDVAELIFRIGNLTLLDKTKNNFSKNEFITKKCEKAYNISNLKINEGLKNLTEWNEESIEKREKDFLNEALEIWKID